jgi:hypothetical protein
MRDHSDADMRSAAETQESAPVAAQFAEGGKRLVVFLKYAPGIRKKEGSGFREHQLPAGPLVEFLAGVLLEQADLVENCWWREVQLLPSLPEVRKLPDADQGSKMGEFHKGSISVRSESLNVLF